METPAEELLKKIQELEAGQARLKLEMSKLMPADEDGARRSDRGRSHSVSPQRTPPPPLRRNSGGLDGAPLSWGRGSSSFGHSSRLQRESRGATSSDDGAAGIRLSEQQYLNILQSMGQSVHIFDLEGRIIYWSCSDHDEISSDHKEDGASSGASTPRGEATLGAFGKPYAVLEEKSPGKPTRVNNDEDEGKSGIYKIISKTEALFANKGILWPWKGHEQGGNDAKNRFVWPWLHGDHENDYSHPKVSESGTKTENHPTENNRTGNNEASGSWSSLNVNSTSSVSSCGSTGSSAVHKVDVDTDCLDYEILWEDLTIGEQIGQGSCGTVYHALWYGSWKSVPLAAKKHNEVRLEKANSHGSRYCKYSSSIQNIQV
ncbi:hypothetical protein GW17_00013351 [Ensete ventricosum]|nr:hypothetical protein GW17_00013351 [Ensete ventricosum]